MPQNLSDVSSYSATELETSFPNAIPASNDLFYFWDRDEAGTLKVKTIQRDALTALLNDAILVDVAASRTLQLSDRGKTLRSTSATAITLTVPADATVPYPAGTRIALTQYGAGSVSVAAAAGVTINKHPLDGLTLDAQYSSAVLTRIAANEWLLEGRLQAL